ncbi:DNA cytosine methyltransferase [Rhodovarius crocodyli]|uniref:DNA (cytosine-5-)-methyltransferase n=1 Tax=Rhodovarius crocodyli TaxID=1979269 RepID=A0A437MF62_9PROT|nr:DNA cytosine methyltransferase [Rhodovarius crocodyli]RVT96277.1 DNA cytosine methyltransferase [Rhodovarius crocodyli]
MPDGGSFRRRRRPPAPNPAQWPLDEGITVVLFAGLGGACAGLEEAGCPVHVAVNHDAVAIAAHQALHPHTKHLKGDIFDIDPVAATGGRRVKVLWASPDCRDHSVAKGGAPRSPRVRSLAWQVCRWVGKTRPEIVLMENVREIRGWGPLIAKRDKATGRVLKLDDTVAAKGEHVPRQQQQLVRDKRRLGRSFRAFVKHLERLGATYQDRDLCCADFGVPTTRRRWFAVLSFDGSSPAWPVQSHAEEGKGGLLPWVPAYSIIDWSLPIPSIFERPKPLVDATHQRIAFGLRREVLDHPQPFFIPLTHSGPPRSYPSTGPLPTLTTAQRGEFAVIAPKLAAATMIQTGYGERPGQAPRALDIQAPLGTVVASSSKHAVVAAWMAQHNLGNIGNPVSKPLSTLTTRGTQQQVCAAYFAHLRGTGTSLSAQDPLPTLTAGGNHIAAVAAFMTKYYGEGGVSQSCTQALDTVTTKARFGVVTASFAGEQYILHDIGMRMLEPHEAAAAHELELPKQIVIDGVARALSKTESMRLIGNSVPKRMARLLAERNVVHRLAALRGARVA